MVSAAFTILVAVKVSFIQILARKTWQRHGSSLDSDVAVHNIWCIAQVCMDLCLKGDQMSKNFEDVGAFGKEFFDGGLKAFAAYSSGAQAIAIETSDYAKKAIEDSISAWQSVAAAKSFEKAVEIQSAYLKSSYESFVAEASKLNGLYADLAKDAYRPFEDVLAKAK